MTQLAIASHTAADHYPPLLRSPRAELQRGWQIYVDGQPIEACATLMERKAWNDAAMVTVKVNTKGLN